MHPRLDMDLFPLFLELTKVGSSDALSHVEMVKTKVFWACSSLRSTE